MFCEKCGKQIPDNSRVCQYCGVPVMGQPQNMNVNYQPMKPKKTPWKIIVPIVAVLLVIAIVIAVVVCGKKKDDAKLIEILEKYTDEPIVELICEDFDDNGEKEAYAVVGDSEEKEEYTEYIDADVYFVNQTEAEIIKEDVSGHSNGTIEVDDTIYVSFEIYDDEAETGYSYVYTAEENEPAEAEISGKYSDVHQDGMKIYATDANGQIIEIEIEPKESGKTEEPSKTSLEPTEEDWKTLNKFISFTSYSHFYYDENSGNDFNCEASDAVKRANEFASGFLGQSEVYRFFFGEDGMEEFVSDEQTNSDGTFVYETPDPLGKFGQSPCYFRYPADRIDWIIENVLNVTPDRTVSTQDYYYDGDYFYTEGNYGGDIGCEFELEQKTPLGDGKYKVEVYGYSPEGYSENNSPYEKITATVSLKEIDGKRVCSFYEYKRETI